MMESRAVENAGDSRELFVRRFSESAFAAAIESALAAESRLALRSSRVIESLTLRRIVSFLLREIVSAAAVAGSLADSLIEGRVVFEAELSILGMLPSTDLSGRGACADNEKELMTSNIDAASQPRLSHIFNMFIIAFVTILFLLLYAGFQSLTRFSYFCNSQIYN